MTRTYSPDLLDLRDRSVWARQIASQKRRKTGAEVADLEEAIVGLEYEDTIVGSSRFTVSMTDPEFDLLDSGFFDTDDDGRLNAIDVNYPEGTNLWWRLAQVSVRASAPEITLTFVERAAVYLQQHKGPLKVSRAKKTRAEFLKQLTEEVRAHGGLKFVCSELTKVQPIEGIKERPQPKDERERRENKEGGIDRSEKIEFTNFSGSGSGTGAKYTFRPGELANAEKVLDAAFQITTSERAILALLTACIVEAPFFRNPAGGDRDSRGILQIRDSTAGPMGINNRSIEDSVRAFLTKGFYSGTKLGGGGAIAIAKRNPQATVGEIAQATQGSAHPGRYDEVLDGAEKILQAYGGGPSTTGETYRKQYNFERGSVNDPNENSWDCMNRLADQVNWRLFIDGNRVYYDSEPTLARQKVAGVLDREDGYVLDFDFTWDHRNVATEMTIELMCEPFQFRAGEALKLNGFGPASSGSTLVRKPKRPGVWLISQVRRDLFALSAQITLKQPEAPNNEPAPQTGTRTRNDDEEYGTDAEGLRKKIVDVAKQTMTEKTGHRYYLAGGDQSRLEDPTPPPPFRSDCSQWIHAVYLKAGAPSPGVTTVEMFRKGKHVARPKPGDIVLDPNGTKHCELYIGNGQTIGHGTEPIDFWSVEGFRGYFGGAVFVTYDFFSDNDERSRSLYNDARDYTKGGPD